METTNQDQNQNTNMNNEQIDTTALQQPSDSNQHQENTNGSTDERIGGQKLFDFSDIDDVDKFLELLQNPQLCPYMFYAVVQLDKSVAYSYPQLDFVPSFANLIQFGPYSISPKKYTYEELNQLVEDAEDQ